MSARSSSSPLSSVSSSLVAGVVRRSAVAVLAAGAMLGGTAVTPVLLATAAAAEPEPAAEGPSGEGAVGVLGGLTDAGHRAVDAVGAAGGAVTDVVNGPAPAAAPAAAPAPVSEPPPRPTPPQPAPVAPRAAPPQPAPVPRPAPPQNLPPPPAAPAPAPTPAPAVSPAPSVTPPPPPSSAVSVPDKAVPVRPAAVTATPVPVASDSGGESPSGPPTSRPEENHGKDCCVDVADRGSSAGAGSGGGEQVSRSVEDARAAVALLDEFLDALEAEPASPVGAGGEAGRAVLDVAAGSGRSPAVGSAVGEVSVPVAPSERPVDTAAPKSPASGSGTVTRTADEHTSAGQSSGPQGEAPGGAQQSEGLAAGVEKLTEQAARAAVADPDAVALLETLTDPELNLDDLDSTTSSSTDSAGSAGETVSRTNGAPAAEASSVAAQEPDAAAAESSAPVVEKSSGAVPERVWDALAECESGGDWATRTGDGFAGGLQFTPSTWATFGGTGAAHEASRAEQIAVAQRVQEGQGWGAWPACSKRLGLTD